MKNMKKLLVGALACTFVFSIAGCGANKSEEPAASGGDTGSAPTEAAAPSTSEPQAEGPVVNTEDGMIGIAIPGADHGWTAGIAYYAQQKAEEMGLVEGTDYKLLTSSDVNDQANDIDELITAGCTSILLLPHNDEVSVAAQKILDAGINLVVFDRKVTTDYTAYLAGNNPGIGTNAAKYIGDALEGKGTVAVMSAPSVGSVSVERTDAFKEAMAANYPDITLVDATADGFTQEAGLTMASDLLTAQPELDAIYSIDDEPSLGILQAVKEAKRTDVKFISGGGGSQGWYQKIKDEKDITLFTETYSPSMIGDALELTKSIQQGNAFEKDTILDNDTVDANNVADYLDEGSPY